MQKFPRPIVRACLLSLLFTAALCVCSCGSKFVSNNNAGSTPASTPTIPPEIHPENLIRAFWFYYPHEPSPGRRYWLQVAENKWLERYPNGFETEFKVLGRLDVKGIEGSVLVKAKGNFDVTRVPDDGSFQVFIPDQGAASNIAMFRAYSGGKWQDWRDMAPMNVIK
jgi:hypothetical protein